MRPVIRWALVAVVTVHGLIHLLGAAKGFRWADVRQLRHEISAGMAAAWLLAAVLVLGSAVLLALGDHWWWTAMAVAAAVSQIVVATSWSDAKAGSVVNVVMLLAAGYGYAAQRPRSFAAG